MESNRIISLKTVKNFKTGELHFTDNNIPFNTKRIFLLNNFYDLTDNNKTRGLHVNLNFDEFIIVNEGYIDVKIIKKNKDIIEFRLNKNECLYFSRGYWLEFIIGTINTSITVLANMIQSESISCYNFEEFINS